MPKTYIQFERFDKVRIKGSHLVYTVLAIDTGGEPKYNPDSTDAIITGGGLQRRVPVEQLELAV